MYILKKKSGETHSFVLLSMFLYILGETFLSYIHNLLQVLLLKFGNTKTDIPCLTAGAFVS